MVHQEAIPPESAAAHRWWYGSMSVLPGQVEPGIHTDGTTRHVINAVDAWTGESFTVSAGTPYEAVVELARQTGVDIEDG